LMVPNINTGREASWGDSTSASWQLNWKLADKASYIAKFCNCTSITL